MPDAQPAPKGLEPGDSVDAYRWDEAPTRAVALLDWAVAGEQPTDHLPRETAVFERAHDGTWRAVRGGIEWPRAYRNIYRRADAAITNSLDAAAGGRRSRLRRVDDRGLGLDEVCAGRALLEIVRHALREERLLPVTRDGTPALFEHTATVVHCALGGEPVVRGASANGTDTLGRVGGVVFNDAEPGALCFVLCGCVFLACRPARGQGSGLEGVAARAQSELLAVLKEEEEQWLCERRCLCIADGFAARLRAVLAPTAPRFEEGAWRTPRVGTLEDIAAESRGVSECARQLDEAVQRFAKRRRCDTVAVGALLARLERAD